MAALEGIWEGDDRALYYIRQIGSTVWWAGLSFESDKGVSDFQPGIRFANVFRGEVEFGKNISGDWSDVPRGRSLGSGHLLLNISLDGATLTLNSQTGDPFAARKWRRVELTPPAFDLHGRFDHVFRNDHGTMRHHLKAYKDNVVLLGTVESDAHLNYPDGQDRSYPNFMCGDGYDREENDGDLVFELIFNYDELNAQPGVWTDGWVNPPEDIRAKLNYELSTSFEVHVEAEAIMYGRPSYTYVPIGNGLRVLVPDCEGKNPALLPGWMEPEANSVLVNGMPVNGAVVKERRGPPGATRRLSPTVLNEPVDPERRVRVCGVLALDCHGGSWYTPWKWSGDCEDKNEEVANVELHPFYSIDFFQDFKTQRGAGANLTGAWMCSDVGTYYLRQIGATVWWLGLSADRGRTFARVFKGLFDGKTAVGEFADVPLGGTDGQGQLAMEAGITGDLSTELLSPSSAGIFKKAYWRKLYDVPRI